ncbi:MAG: DUF1499 domain-containing protein [Gemmatimonadota bacterium]
MKRYLPLLLAVVAAALLLLSGVGVRAGWWSFRTGFIILKWAAYVGLATTLVAVIVLLVPRLRANSVAPALIALLVGAAVVYVPWSWQRRARAVPAIHDITTDTERPPEFVAILPLRADAPNPAEYEGSEVAAEQQEAYPDIKPLMLNVPPDFAFGLAHEAAQDMGWEIVAADSAARRIEATATTTWFGFKDDVVVRIEPEDAGSRIDVRSVSRVGKGDAGTNAARIRKYLQRVEQEL